MKDRIVRQGRGYTSKSGRNVARAAVLALLLPSARVAVAQSAPPGAAQVTLAREQFRAGMAAAKVFDWEAARQAFERSYQLAPRPITLLNLGGAQLQTQHYVSAAENYRRFLREATSGPAADQRDAAKQELARAESRIARLQLTVYGLERDDRLLLDADSVPAAAVSGLDIPMDPGEHSIAILRAGVELQRQTVHLEDHETRPLVFTLLASAATGAGRDPGSVRTSGRGGFDLGEAPPAATEGSHSIFASPWFWTAIGVVAAGSVAAILIETHSSASTPAPYTGNVPPGSMVIP